jgi:phage protein U
MAPRASDRFGARPAVQFIGPGDDDVTIAAPASRDRGPLQRARYAGQHGRHRQCLGADERMGEVWGYYVIVGLDLTHQTMMAGGIPRRIDFSVTLKRKA